LGRPLVLGAVLALLGVCALQRWSQTDVPTGFLRSGETLLHGLDLPGVAYIMPFSSVTEALLSNHLPPAARQASLQALAILSLLLAFALGRGLHSPSCGLLAAGWTAFSWDLFSRFGGLGEHVLYSLALLLAANVLVRLPRLPEAAGGAALGAAVGCSLLVRSPLLLFPPALLLWDLFARRSGSPPRSRSTWLPLFGIPALFLLPWIYMNWRIEGRFIPLEDGRGHYNMVSAALGVPPGEAGTRLFALAGISSREDVLSWTVGRVFGHPLLYLEGFLRRCLYGISLQPWLFAFACAGLILHRRREEFRLVAVYVAYFVGLHCLMSVEERYFSPLWPLLAALAASPIAGILGPEDPEPELSWSRVFTGACLAAVVVAGAGSLALVAAYPHRRASGGTLELAAARHPRDPWLWSELGRRRMAAGNRIGGGDAFAKAFSLRPDPERELDHAWSLIASGGRPGGIIDRIPLARVARLPEQRTRLRLLTAVRRLTSGTEAESRQSLRRAREERSRECSETLCSGALQWDFPAEIERYNDDVGEALLAALQPFPLKQRSSLLRRSASWAGDDANSRLRSVEVLLQSGDRKQARSVAQDILRDAAAVRHTEAKRWVSLAETAFHADEPEMGRQALQAAHGLRPTGEVARRMARLWRSAGRPQRAKDLLEELLREDPADARLWVERGWAEQEAGDPAAASESAARALLWAESPEDLSRLAELFGALGDKRKAVDLLRSAVRSRPGDAQLRLDLSAAALSAGDRALAWQELSAAQVRSVGDDSQPREVRAGRKPEGRGRAAASPASTESRSVDAALAYFRSGDNPRGFQEYHRVARASSPGSAHRVEALCGEPGRDCRPLRAALDELRRLNQEAILLGGGEQRFAEALTLLEKAVTLDPQDVDSRINAGMTAQMTGRTDLALLHFGEAVRLRPAKPGVLSDVLCFRAGLLESMGRPGEAVADMEAALRQAPQDWALKGDAQTTLGRLRHR